VAVVVATVAVWQCGSGSGWVAVWQWVQWQCGGVAGEKMVRIGWVLREIRVFVAVGVDEWLWQWQWQCGSKQWQ
jgi:hypothetical protein